MPKTPPSSLPSKTATVPIAGRVSAYRQRLTTSAYHRVDVFMPDEKRPGIEKIAAELNETYAQTVSALAQWGLAQLEAAQTSAQPNASVYVASKGSLIPQHPPFRTVQENNAVHKPMNSLHSLSVFGVAPQMGLSHTFATHNARSSTVHEASVASSVSPSAIGDPAIESPLMAFFRKRKAAP